MANWFETNFFGGAEKSAGRKERDMEKRAREEYARNLSIGREDATRLYDASQGSRSQTLDMALEAMRGSLPQSADISQKGNVKAQQVLLDAFPQIQNAIFGNQVDMSAFKPRKVGTDFSFLEEAVGPDFELISEILKPTDGLSAQAQNIHPNAQATIDAYLRGDIPLQGARERLASGNAPGSGNKFPGMPQDLIDELLPLENLLQIDNVQTGGRQR